MAKKYTHAVLSWNRNNPDGELRIELAAVRSSLAGAESMIRTMQTRNPKSHRVWEIQLINSPEIGRHTS